VRNPVWDLAQDSAGLRVRFVTDAPTIRARWTLRKERLAMPHMPATGVSGLDLYVRLPGGWHWAATAARRNQQRADALQKGLAAAASTCCTSVQRHCIDRDWSS
jgi:hypothetical protein